MLISLNVDFTKLYSTSPGHSQCESFYYVLLMSNRFIGLLANLLLCFERSTSDMEMIGNSGTGGVLRSDLDI